MATPETYSAQDELMKSMLPPAEAVAKPVTPIDEERYILRPYDHWQVVTDLRNWHTFLVADRIAKAEKYAAVRGKQLDLDRKVAADKWKRYMIFILLREIIHPNGDRRVAQVCFDALFPVKKTRG